MEERKGGGQGRVNKIMKRIGKRGKKKNTVASRYFDVVLFAVVFVCFFCYFFSNGDKRIYN